VEKDSNRKPDNHRLQVVNRGEVWTLLLACGEGKILKGKSLVEKGGIVIGKRNRRGILRCISTRWEERKKRPYGGKDAA